MTRRALTILLLESRTAWHPQVKSQFSTFGALPGEKATQRETCSQCSGDCTTPSRTGPVPCERCDGKGSYLVDAYTGYRSSDEGPWRGGSLTKVEKGRLVDAEIQRMQAQTAPPRSEQDIIAETLPEPWERSRDKHYRHGDYRALDLAMEWLAGSAPNAFMLVQWVYELGMIRATNEQVRSRAEAAVDLLCTRMPDRIRVPVWVLPPHPAAQRIAARKAAA